jgi:hypothetical protein
MLVLNDYVTALLSFSRQACGVWEVRCVLSLLYIFEILEPLSLSAIVTGELTYTDLFPFTVR